MKNLAPWAAVIAVGAFLRTRLIGQLGTLWYDEAFSWRFAREPLGKMLDVLRLDVHPPFHAVLLHFWMKIFGDGVYAMRSLSLATAVIGLTAFAALGRKLVGKQPAFLALMLASLSPIMAYYGADARMYAAVFCLSALSSLYFWRAHKGEAGSEKPWFWWSLALALTHATGALVVAAQAAFLLRTTERRRTFKRLFSRFAIIGAAFALWLVPVVTTRLGYAGGEWQFHAASTGAVGTTALDSLVDWVWLSAGRAQTILALILFALLMIAGMLNRSERRPRLHVGEENEYLLFWFLFAFLPFLPLGAAPPRYLVAAVPPLFLMLANGFVNAGRDRRYILLLGAAAIILASFTGLMVQLTTRPYDWDRNVDWIIERNRPGDRVVFGWFADKMAFDATQAEPFKRDLSSLETREFYPFDDALDEDHRLAAHAGTLTIRREDLDRLGPLFEDAQRIFFIPNYDWKLVGSGSLSEALNDWFRAHGWYLADHRDADGRTPGVWLMVRKK